MFQSIDLVHLQIAGKHCLSDSEISEVISTTHQINIRIVHLTEKMEKMINYRVKQKQYLLAISAF